MAEDRWTVAQEDKLRELLDAKKAAQLAEDAKFRALLGSITVYGEIDEDSLISCLRENAKEFVELLIPYVPRGDA